MPFFYRGFSTIQTVVGNPWDFWFSPNSSSSSPGCSKKSQVLQGDWKKNDLQILLHFYIKCTPNGGLHIPYVVDGSQNPKKSTKDFVETPLDLLREISHSRWYQQYHQWSFLVPLIGGRYHIITRLAIYKWYISGIYCQLGDCMVPTTY